MFRLDDIDIRYLGFHPSDWTKSYLASSLAALRDQLPFGSRLKVMVKRQGHLLVANVDVLSRAGRWFIPAKASKLSQLCHTVESRVHRQIEKWRDAQRRGHR
jgi:hypothetical protein